MTGSTRYVAVGALVAILGIGCADAPSLSESTSSGPPESELFVDPHGSYTMFVDPDWFDNHGSFTADTELWFLTPPIEGTLSPNVNVITQSLGTDVTLEDYLDLSIEGADAALADFTPIETGIIEGSADQPLGLMEYQASFSGDSLHFLAIFAVQGDEAVVATLTATPDSFDRFRSMAEPYLLTLEPR